MVELVVSDKVSGEEIAMDPFNLILLLNMTGPSNCERILFEFPPSTNRFCLIVTWSKITLNAEGFSPLTVGIGIPKRTSVPFFAPIFLLPI